MKVVAFGDLHLGNIMCDLPAFQKALNEVVGLRPDAVVFLGDVIDGALKYATQIYRQFPLRTIDVQRALFRKYVVEPLIGKCEKIVVVRGNHDSNFIEDFLKPATDCFPGIVHYGDRWVIDDVLYTHYVLRRGRGSYATGITPMMVSLSQSVALEHRVEKIVFAHIHRCAVHVISGGIEIVALPSFMRFEDAYDSMYTPAYALIQDGVITLKKVSKSDIKQVQKANVDAVSEVIKEMIDKEGKLIT